jgi:hypothetical protein
MAWQNPKTDWQAADVVSKDDFNRIEGNVQELQNTKETPAGAQAKAEAAAGAVQAELDTHKADYAALEKFGHVKHGVLTATLNTSWSGSSAPYSKTVTVSGILATDTPIIDIVMSGTYSTDEARIEAWGYIYRAVTANGSITFYATEKPTVSLPIQIKVVR